MAGMFDMFLGGMGGLDGIAAKIGVTPEQMQALMTEIGSKIASGETNVAALTSVAAEHGVSADKLQELFGQFGGPDAIMKTLGGFFNKDGESPLGSLGGLGKGLFG